MGVHRYVFRLYTVDDETDGVANYDVNELWYEYEAKKKAGASQAQAQKDEGMAVE
jgi:phosphatidylethanolamine-binding protein (PEBP) family uncharacterized protein